MLTIREPTKKPRVKVDKSQRAALRTTWRLNYSPMKESTRFRVIAGLLAVCYMKWQVEGHHLPRKAYKSLFNRSRTLQFPELKDTLICSTICYRDCCRRTLLNVSIGSTFASIHFGRVSLTSVSFPVSPHSTNIFALSTSILKSLLNYKPRTATLFRIWPITVLLAKRILSAFPNLSKRI